MSATDFHLRVDSDLDKQIEREAVFRRTSKNQLIATILQRALNPNPDDEATIFRRLDRVEKAVNALENAVRQHVQQEKQFRQEWIAKQQHTLTVQEDAYTSQETFQTNVVRTSASIQSAVSQLRSFLDTTMTTRLEQTLATRIDDAIAAQAQTFRDFLREAVQHTGHEGQRFLRKMGEVFFNRSQ